jgi:hypothetical protein
MKKLLLLFLAGVFLLSGCSLCPEGNDDTGITRQAAVYLDGTASTSALWLWTTTSTKSWEIDTAGAKSLGLDIQVAASSSAAASALKFDIDVSDDGIDWFDLYSYDMTTLTATVTPVTAIASESPYFIWAPGTINTVRRRFNFEDWNAKHTRFNFALASTTLHMTIWAQAIKGY